MSRLVVELTDRCNLRCAHCFDGRHGGRGWLSDATLAAVLEAALAQGIREVSFTGGEPTLHPRFAAFCAAVAARGLRLGLVTNGWDFPRHLPALQAVRASLGAITFSLDGASAAVHDAQRGPGSYERVLTAAALCRDTGLPFSFNLTVTRRSAHEAEALLIDAARRGALGVRLIPYLAHPRRDDDPLDLPLPERVALSLQMAALKARHDREGFRVGLAPGFFHPDPAPCASLHGQELNMDWCGRLDLCCHLSGRERGIPREPEPPFAIRPALDAQRRNFVAARVQRFAGCAVGSAERFACDHCLAHWRRPMAAVAA